MFSETDTIVAIATPAGRGALGVVRLSGPDAARIAGALTGRSQPFDARLATFARLALPKPDPHQAQLGDHAVITWFEAPHSATGDDVVEISVHGSAVILRGVLAAAVGAGARLAEPGEFTLRAFLNGKLDLIQAEAVGDLIEAVTPLQARTAFDQLEGTLTEAIAAIEAELFDLIARLEASLDFPDEGYHFVEPGQAAGDIDRIGERIDTLLAHAARGRLVREGAQIAIVGTPNVGKSSLFNAFVNANRAIVTAVPGTTRDLLTEQAEIGGWSFGLVDTAGVRDTVDVVEHEGVARARQAAAVADVVLVVLDRSRALEEEDRAVLAETAKRPRVVVVNKIDLPPAWERSVLDGCGRVAAVSVESGEGMDGLVTLVGEALGGGEGDRDRPLVSNLRHITLLGQARAALTRAATAVRNDTELPEELLLADLQEAAALLQEIRGQRTSEELLRHIFERFCIGK